MSTTTTAPHPNGRDRFSVTVPVHNFSLRDWLATDRTADVIALVEAERIAIANRENAAIAETILAELSEIARHTNQI